MYASEPHAGWRPLTFLASLLIVLQLSACQRNESNGIEREGGAPLECEAGVSEASELHFQSGDVLYIGLDTTLSADEPHVLAVDESGETRIDGALASTAPQRARQRGGLALSYLDQVGRSIELSLCIDSRGRGSGRIVRCRGERCESGTVTALPLVHALGPAVADAGPARWQLVDEYVDPAWPMGPTIDLAASGALVVLARGADGLRILTTGDADRKRIEELAHVPPARDDFYNDVKLYAGRFALAASRLHGLVVVDLAEPEAPRIVYDRLDVAYRASGHNVFVQGERAYLARSDPGGHISVVDLSSPSSPLVGAEITLNECTDIHDLHVAGDRAFINCFDGRLLVVDSSDEADWVVLDSVEQQQSHSSWFVRGESGSVLLSSGETYAGQVELTGVADSGKLEQLDAVPLGSAASVHTLECSASRCFVAAYQQGWLEIDILAPNSPTILHHEATWRGPGQQFFEGATGTAISGDVLQVADTERGLLVYQRSADE